MFQQTTAYTLPMNSYTNTHKTQKIYLNETTLNQLCVFFLDAVKNKIMPGTFTRIIYSNELFTTNGLHYKFHLNVMNMGAVYNKTLYRFNPDQNGLKIIKQLEKTILAQYEAGMKQPKPPLLKIHEVLNSGNLKIFDQAIASHQSTSHQSTIAVANTVKNTHFCLKIIGIWESDTEYGIIYKFSLF